MQIPLNYLLAVNDRDVVHYAYSMNFLDGTLTCMIGTTLNDRDVVRYGYYCVTNV